MIAKRIQMMKPSATSALFGKVAKLKEEGVDIISFNVGEPDFPTPDEIILECKNALDNGRTKYVPVAGIPQLKQAICRKLEKDNGICYDQDQICITTGAKQALYNTVMAICDPGDEILLPIPCWVSYYEMIKLAQGVPVLVPVQDDYQLDIDEIRSHITDRTKGIVINTPNNPTGACYTEESMRALGELAAEHGFYIISDEVYEKLIYDKNVHVSPAALSKEICDHTVVINGLSKSHAMTGWRIGYLAGPKELVKAVTGLQSHITSNSTTFVQWAALSAFDMGEDKIDEMREKFRERRDYIYHFLQNIRGISCVKPGGAFYLMPDVSSFFGKMVNGKEIKDASDFCMYMLEEAKIAMVPGDAFFVPGSVRVAYTESLERIQEGMNRFERALNKIQ